MNMDTIWDETYKAARIHVDAHSDLRITTAIHKDNGAISDLDFTSYTTNGRIGACVKLNADQLKKLAAELLAAAQRRRGLDTMLALHQAEQLPEAA
ncbi:MAG: hypothetical protein ACKO0Z_09885 [Betaproteobacteria bacterium]